MVNTKELKTLFELALTKFSSTQEAITFMLKTIAFAGGISAKDLSIGLGLPEKWADENGFPILKPTTVPSIGTVVADGEYVVSTTPLLIMKDFGRTLTFACAKILERDGWRLPTLAETESIYESLAILKPLFYEEQQMDWKNAWTSDVSFPGFHWYKSFSPKNELDRLSVTDNCEGLHALLVRPNT